MNKWDEDRDIIRSRGELRPVMFLKLVEYLAHEIKSGGNGMNSCEEMGIATHCDPDSFFWVLIVTDHIVHVLDVDPSPKVQVGIDVRVCVSQPTPNGCEVWFSSDKFFIQVNFEDKIRWSGVGYPFRVDNVGSARPSVVTIAVTLVLIGMLVGSTYGDGIYVVVHLSGHTVIWGGIVALEFPNYRRQVNIIFVEVDNYIRRN